MRVDHTAFYASLFLSRLADQILLFVVPLVVFQVTQSAAWSGVVFFAETLPRFLSFPVCGALCDRVSPFRLLRISQMFRATTCVLGAAASGLTGNVAWLVAVSVVCGVLTTQGVMAREVMLPQVFREFRTEKVLAHAQIADQLGMVLGPLLAALALDGWSWVVVLGATAVLFLAADTAMKIWRSASSVELVEPALVHPIEGMHWLQPYRKALVHVLHLPGLVQLITLSAGVNLVIGVTLATSAAMVTGTFHRSGNDYAALQTGGAVATVIILLLIARLSLPLRGMGLVSYGCILLGGVATAFSNGPLAYAIGFLMVIGFDKMFSVYIRTRRFQVIPTADLGKTTGLIVMLNNLTQPVAGLVVGLFAGQANARGVIVAMTVGMAMLGGLAIFFGGMRK
ncbi:MFS transporter [Rhodoferax sp.]|uniref:MFS transporter n=1 Tax=Rhodoferax sp. TaxID=50421 RepID=UPI0028407C5E|nr:MFS transporter [Rhodoferax sp.]MDR3368341.1 MFS transporter [Rhodoferax sp.]